MKNCLTAWRNRQAWNHLSHFGGWAIIARVRFRPLALRPHLSMGLPLSVGHDTVFNFHTHYT